ncbi:xanthine dehydrogenase, molybdenum binding subunit apoprotein [Lentzea waywayandensis]|uniref:Xanthine dehydrogenase, molybdenum binding subunit apoprotein n=1 Tax=Lentzea waywayandensis TaxID=84724 RepID=A0A1I6FJ14_9PSEU|nr:xanthine dehydrogenase family protein molybdopterin-binding subunit [Lentzea waywayandensis]SFR29943.1 xanthine dehydrogenase, molybdenum binding subunit apoprotein [Lentzea waywayandensis]
MTALDRVDAPLKVSGSAPYPSDFTLPDQVHAVLVQSTVAAGRISAIDTTAALAAPGVLAVITHENAPPLADLPMTPLGAPPRFPFKDDRIIHCGQHVAVVVAGTHEQAASAARLVQVSYETAKPVLDLDDPRAEVVDNGWGMEVDVGDAEAALSSAEITYEETFDIAPEANNPLGLFTTLASWDSDRLTVHDCSQWPIMTRQALATAFGLPESDVRVLVPYLGGGFGAGLRAWSHTLLAALAARVVGRPVKLVLTRPQMFTSVGHRARSRQRLRLGMTGAGRLVAIDQESTAALGAEEDNFSAVVLGTPHAYDCPNVATHDRQVRLNIPNPGFMRAPGHAEGNFALESALDELSYRVGIDPVELRLRNFAEVHPQSGLPWSSNALRECLQVGAERFGWRDRSPVPRSTRDGNWLVGYGMAGVTFGWYAAPCRARLSILASGTAVLKAAATDIGTGTYTIAAQQVAELLGLRVDQVRVEIGDSDLPPAPQSGGSGLAVALTGAIQVAAANLLRALLDEVAADARSPLRGRRLDEVTASDGRLHLIDDPAVGEKYADVLARHGLDELTADGELDLAAAAADAGVAPAGAFAARFAEVRVDEDLGLLRVTRLLSVVDGGRILNEKTARSQIIGGTVMGIGMAMFEEVAFDHATGRVANATFGDYLIPVNADVPDLDVVFVGGPDAFSPTGVKGLGEVGVVGVPAAIANAVYHATGRRIRSLPITIDQLM